MQPEKHTGLSRLGRYTVGRRRRISLIMLIAAISAAAPVLGWTIVGDAIDNGIKASNETRLTVDVVLYIAVGATAWILGTTTWLMLAGVGQQIVLDLRRTSSTTSPRSRSATSRSRRPAGSSPG